LTKEVTVKQTGGIGILGFMFLIMFTLKLCSVEPVANWSWWWVTAPIWGPITIGVSILAIFLGIMLIVHVLEVASRR